MPTTPSAARWASGSAPSTCAASAAAFRATASAATTGSPSAATMNAVGAQTAADRHRQRQLRRHAPSSTCRPPAPNGFDPATFALSLFSASANRFLNLEISALEADGKGKVVSSPRVDHRRPAQGADRAGRGAALPGGHLQRRHLAAVPQGQPQARSDAADHARRQRHPRRRRQQGQRRPRHRRPASPSTPSTSRPRCWSRTAARW